MNKCLFLLLIDIVLTDTVLGKSADQIVSMVLKAELWTKMLWGNDDTDGAVSDPTAGK